MARPYSDDLRRKLLEAYDQGKGSLSELAERFGVSLAWAWKISAERRRTGRMERAGHVPSPRPRVDDQAVAELLRAHADTTLVELQAELKERSGLSVSTQHLWRVVKRLGFRLKRSHSTPRNGAREKAADGVNIPPRASTESTLID